MCLFWSSSISIGSLSCCRMNCSISLRWLEAGSWESRLEQTSEHWNKRSLRLFYPWKEHYLTADFPDLPRWSSILLSRVEKRNHQFWKTMKIFCMQWKISFYFSYLKFQYILVSDVEDPVEHVFVWCKDLMEIFK